MHMMLRLDQIRCLQTATGEGCGVATVARPGCGRLPGAWGRAGSCWGQVPAPGSQSPHWTPGLPPLPQSLVWEARARGGCAEPCGQGLTHPGLPAESVPLEWSRRHSQTQNTRYVHSNNSRLIISSRDHYEPQSARQQIMHIRDKVLLGEPCACKHRAASRRADAQTETGACLPLSSDGCEHHEHPQARAEPPGAASCTRSPCRARRAPGSSAAPRVPRPHQWSRVGGCQPWSGAGARGAARSAAGDTGSSSSA